MSKYNYIGTIDVQGSLNADVLTNSKIKDKVSKILAAYIKGDWGCVSDEQKAINDNGIGTGAVIVGKYPLAGRYIEISTNAERTKTVIKWS